MNSDEKSRKEISEIASELEALSTRFSKASTGLSGKLDDVKAATNGFGWRAALLHAIALPPAVADEQPECELPRCLADAKPARQLADAPYPVADAQDAEAELA